MKPRPYQVEAIDALNDWLANNDGNPVIVLPTGAGKTPCMAWLIQQYVGTWPDTRIMVLAHVRELIEQGVEKMKAIWPQAPVGVYSAGLNSRDMHYSITYASIQSVWRRACDFDPFDLIFIDEAHRIPPKGEAMYRSFIKNAKLVNPKVRIVGWTATPFRMNGGSICGNGQILIAVAYEANVRELIDGGYLCKLRSKAGDAAADAGRVSIAKGEFVTSELMGVVTPLVQAAVTEAVSLLEGRKSVLFFAVTVEHAEQVSLALSQHGFYAPVVCAITPSDERAKLIGAFTAGQLRGLVNVNVLSEGFDAQRVDAIVMLRPTASPGLYYQQVGRGLRTHPTKQDALVLDFAGNVERHGPIDVIKGKRVEVMKCPDCKTIFAKHLNECPDCGWYLKEPCGECGELVRFGTAVCPACKYLLIGKNCKGEDCGVRNVLTAPICINCGRPFPREEKEVSHDTKASLAAILSNAEPWRMDVASVHVDKHEKEGKPPSLKVTYRSGYEQHSEWVCLQHDGIAGYKAKKWWERRFGQPVPATVDEALGGLFGADAIRDRLKEITEWIRVRQAGRYTEVIDHGLRDGKHGSSENHVRAFSS